MNVIDISSRLFTVADKQELIEALRILAHTHDLSTEQIEMLKNRTKILLEKAGGAEKFFRDPYSAFREILS